MFDVTSAFGANSHFLSSVLRLQLKVSRLTRFTRALSVHYVIMLSGHNLA